MLLDLRLFEWTPPAVLPSAQIVLTGLAVVELEARGRAIVELEAHGGAVVELRRTAIVKLTEVQ